MRNSEDMSAIHAGSVQIGLDFLLRLNVTDDFTIPIAQANQAGYTVTITFTEFFAVRDGEEIRMKAEPVVSVQRRID